VQVVEAAGFIVEELKQVDRAAAVLAVTSVVSLAQPILAAVVVGKADQALPSVPEGLE
jgi:hypothetical protein